MRELLATETGLSEESGIGKVVMTTMQHIPIGLMVAMRDRYGLKQFVETGTYRGQTALLATGYFDLVTTCDIDQGMIDRLSGLRVPPPKRFVAICGNSPAVLQGILADSACPPALIWLDAHWCGGPKLGPECPVLDELRAIGGTRGRNIILIDDVRLFLDHPPPPHDPSQWPTFAQITALCWQLGPTDVVEIIGDVIVIRPQDSDLGCCG